MGPRAQVLGTGSYAEVRRAVEHATGTEYAVKIINKDVRPLCAPCVVVGCPMHVHLCVCVHVCVFVWLSADC